MFRFTAGLLTKFPRGRLALLMLWAAAAPAFAAAAPLQVPATRADCDAAEPFRTLQPQARAAAATARAIALDDRLIRWPGVEGGRFRLLASSHAGLLVENGQPARGADRAWQLTAAAGPVPPALAHRYRHVGPGVTLALPPGARHDALLRSQSLLVQEDNAGRVLAATRVQWAGALDARHGDAAARMSDYGARVTPAGVQLRLWAPTAQSVAVCVYGGEHEPARRVQPLQRDARSGSWSTTVRGGGTGLAYAYLVDVFVPGHGLVRNRVTDPYALALTPDSRRSVAVDPDAPQTQPPGWRNAPRPAALAAPTDAVIYELHVRDFSAGDASVPEALRGRYGAFAWPDGAGARHLRRLVQAGLTDVHLLPVFDLASVPEQGCVTPAIAPASPDSEAPQAAVAAVQSRDCYNWGYDPLHYSAPEGSYASPGASGVQRLVEFRRMVQALHGMGLRVGMDVVYNHTSASGQQPHSVLDRIVPGYYHRLDAEGRVERSTCCDNTATEHRMMAKLMIDSTVAWVRHHQIDAFRFDLMGHQPRAAMLELQRAVDAAAGRRIALIGEGWNFGEVADGARFVQASQLSLNGSGIGTFSDRGRDAVRGGGAGDNGAEQIERQGWVNGLFYAPNALAQGKATAADLQRTADMVRVCLAGSLRAYEMQTHTGERLPLGRLVYGGNQPAGYVSQPAEVVNYVENHDNQTLFDALVFKLPADTPREDRARVQTLASAVVAFSQGIAYFHAGQELLRSKSMDRNSFDSGDWFNRIDWSGQTNHFGSGLPPRQDNGTSWPLMQPLLARAADIAPSPADIAFARGAFLDLLRIRASTSLLRLRSADDIRQRLTLLNTGPAQNPVVLVGHVDGRGYPGATFRELLYAVNADPRPQVLRLETLRGHAFELHPVHRAPAAGDPRPAREAAFDPATGQLTVPARTAVVFVVN